MFLQYKKCYEYYFFFKCFRCSLHSKDKNAVNVRPNEQRAICECFCVFYPNTPFQFIMCVVRLCMKILLFELRGDK